VGQLSEGSGNSDAEVGYCIVGFRVIIGGYEEFCLLAYNSI
jgi:hypothetical protein